MSALRRALLYLSVAVVGLLLGGFVAGWAIVRRALPQLDGAIFLPELQQEVAVDRDAWGVPHIRAASLEDLLVAQGYVLAQDRLWQMDILRRVAAGELSEILGPSTLAMDRENRTLGLRVAAERDAANLDPPDRQLLEAYARGVNRFLADHEGKLPWEFVALRYRPRPWRPADTLLVAGYMYRVLTSSWESELKRAIVTQRVGAELAKDLYVMDSPLDHHIVGETPSEKRTFPPAPSPAVGAALDLSGSGLPVRTDQASPGVEEAWREPPNLRGQERTILNAFDEEVRAALGSNNWVVDGTHTASGKPLLANDTHLPLDVPCIWYLVHLTAPGWDVEGFALPGSPLVIIGHNDRIAWGFTNNGADVQDLYLETFNPENPLEYRVNGNWVKADVRKEVIHVRGRPDDTLDVVTTRHGPIVHREGAEAYALRWTATQPGGLYGSFHLFGGAHNWEEFREVARRIRGPAQNTVYADVDGNIGFLVPARIPIRKNGDGSVPVPGDSDDYEWVGHIPFVELPQVLNPPGGVIATANARVVGPGYPYSLTERWAAPYRTARIYELLDDKKDLRPEDFLAIETDIVSLPHLFLARQLTNAAQAAAPRPDGSGPRDPRTRALLDRLKGWNGAAGADSVEMSFVEFTRRKLMRNLLQPHLGDAWREYQWWREEVFLENVLRERPARWLPPDFRSYDELLVASADQAVEQLELDARSKDITRWQWGQFIRLEIRHPLGRTAWLRRLLGVGPMDQPGARDTVKQTGRSFGPAMRYVADLSDFDNSLMNLTTGESGQLGSPHYRDQFPAWFEGRGLPAPFSDAAEEKSRVHQLRLLPAEAGPPPRR